MVNARQEKASSANEGEAEQCQSACQTLQRDMDSLPEPETLAKNGVFTQSRRWLGGAAMPAWP
jgi:hypothetical protein